MVWVSAAGRVEGPASNVAAYTLTLTTGDSLAWQGDPVSGVNWTVVNGFLVLTNGTLVNLAHVVSMTRVD